MDLEDEVESQGLEADELPKTIGPKLDSNVTEVARIKKCTSLKKTD